MIRYINDQGGYHPALRVLHHSVQLGNEWTKRFSHLETRLDSAVSVLPILTIPALTDGALRSFGDLTQGGRKAVNAIRDAADCIAAYSWSATLFTQNPVVKRTAEVMDFTFNALGVQTSASDYWQAAILESRTVGDAQKVFTHSKHYYLFALIKCVSSVALGVIGLIMMITGVQIVSAVALIALSLSSAIFEMLRDIKKENYPILGFQEMGV